MQSILLWPSQKFPSVLWLETMGLIFICFFFYFFPYFLFVAVLGLHCCVDFSLVFGEQGLLSYGWAQALGHTGFRSCRSWTLEDSLNDVVHGLSCSTTGGTSPDQESDPRLLNWQKDSLPLSHTELLGLFLFKWPDFKSDEWKHFSLRFIL